MTSLSLTVLRNSTIGMAAQMVIKILSFAFSVLIVRRLGAEQFGQYAAVLAFGAIFVFLADLGLSQYTIRSVARLRDRDNGQRQIEGLFGNLLCLRFLLALMTAVLIIASALLTRRPTEMIIAIAIGTLGLLMYSIQGGAEAMLSGFERLDVIAGTRVVQQVAFVVLGGAALILGTGYYGLIVANLGGVLALLVLSWLGIQRLGVHPRKINPQEWPTLIRRGIPFGIIGFTLGLSYKFDTILLNIFWNDTLTGYYNAAYNLVFSAVMISGIFTTALYPSLARQSVRQPDSLPGIHERAMRYSLSIALPIAFGTAVLAEPLIQLLFGEPYLPAVPVLQIIIWVVPLMYLTDLCGYFVVVAGNEHKVARAIAVSTTISIFVNLAMIPTYGLTAAAAMTVLTELILVGQYLWLLRVSLAHLDWGGTVGRPFIAAMGMACVVFLLRNSFLPAVVAVGVGAYLALAVILGAFGKDEIQLLRRWRDHHRAEVMP